MSNKYFLTIDIGTSVSKVILYDSQFKRIAEAHDEISVYHPQPNFFEQNPNQWWTNVKKEIKEVVTKTNPKEIVGVGACAQMHAPILVNNKGTPLFPCLSWPDLRTVEITNEINNVIDVPQPYYTATAPKILWIKRNNPDLIKKTYKILFPKDFVRMKISGTFCTDTNDANGSGMFDEKAGSWNDKVVNYIGVSKDILPEPRKPEEVIGEVTKEAAEETGLVEGIPVITGSADNLGRSLDRNASKARDLLVYIGTGSMIEYISESGARPKGTFRSILGVEGTVPQWFKNNFCEEDRIQAERMGKSTWDFLDSEAEDVGQGAGGLVFLPHMMGERAFEGKTRNETGNFNPYARGVIFGLCLGHSRKHIFRAIMEGTVYQLFLCWERIQSLNPGIVADRIVTSGGGASARVWRQMIADAFGLSVWIPTELETGTLAVACLISVSAGLSESFDSAIKKIDNPLTDVVKPIKENNAKYYKTYGLYKRLEEDLKEILTTSQK
ncbi:MAG: hypothetical protein QG670_145 [Thermoproteota archaeon]|nr:hypothetical protein [Thermoproteota archaeon]